MSALSCTVTPNPLPLLIQRETGFTSDVQSRLFYHRLTVAKNLYRRDLFCHYGCVNAIEFSDSGEYLVSGGDDRRVMFWKFSETLVQKGGPSLMRGQHQSNIFCLGITHNDARIYSGGNDDQVIAHDVSTGRAVELLTHQRAVCGLGVHPQDSLALVTAGNDGRLLYYDTRHSDEESMVIARSRKAFHAVMFHPKRPHLVASANARDGVAMWDVRANKQPLTRFLGHNGYAQNSMSVRFNSTGDRLIALRRRQPPVIYASDAPRPLAEFTHQDYHNSCTMKSCSYAGSSDEYVLSGSDDFGLYVWKIPDTGDTHDGMASPEQVDAHLVLHGHRSIVNQVRYNKQLCVIASSGVEKIVKIWSTVEYPGMSGSLEEISGSDNPREVYSHEDYVSLVHGALGGQYLSHNYAEQSTSEDPRMMAFFDSLVQREAEGLAESVSDSESDGGSDATCRPTSDSDDSDQVVLAYSCVQKRAVNNGRNQRCTRGSRRQPARHPKHLPSQTRGSIVRRSKQQRGLLPKPPACGTSSAGAKTKRAVWRSARGRPPPAPRRSAPSSERTDSDEPSHSLYRHTGKIIRPLRRRMNLSRTLQRKSACSTYRKVESRLNGDDIAMQSCSNMEEEEYAVPSTSSGYRGQNSCLFRIAEVDSDEDRTNSVQTGAIGPAVYFGNAPTPNGSHDSLPTGDSLRSVPESTSNPSSPTPGERAWVPRRSSRRAQRSGAAMRRSDSSESPSPMENRDALHSERLSYSPIVRLLLDETNESEMESSCSTSAHSCVSPTRRHPSEIVPGSSRPSGLSDDPNFALLKFRQRFKRARRNYRSHTGESDSN